MSAFSPICISSNQKYSTGFPWFDPVLNLSLVPSRLSHQNAFLIQSSLRIQASLIDSYACCGLVSFAASGGSLKIFSPKVS
jgi:hypothetical protein